MGKIGVEVIYRLYSIFFIIFVSAILVHIQTGLNVVGHVNSSHTNPVLIDISTDSSEILCDIAKQSSCCGLNHMKYTSKHL